MSAIPPNTSNAFFYDEFEDVRTTFKKHGKVTFEKNSEQIKSVMKGAVDKSADSSTSGITSPCKAATYSILPKPAACVVNAGIASCVEPAVADSIKEIGHKKLDQCVDQEAEKIINKSIDTSIDSTKSLITTIYEYVQSYFA